MRVFPDVDLHIGSRLDVQVGQLGIVYTVPVRIAVMAAEINLGLHSQIEHVTGLKTQSRKKRKQGVEGQSIVDIPLNDPHRVGKGNPKGVSQAGTQDQAIQHLGRESCLQVTSEVLDDKIPAEV